MLKETGFKYVIFSITNHSNLFSVMEMNAVFNSLGYEKPVRCIGAYRGGCENSFMTTTAALDAVMAVGSFWLKELRSQESFLLISECNKQYAALFYQHDGLYAEQQLHPIGSMHAVSREEAQAAENWTYRTDTQQFYIAKKDNPDRVPPPMGWPSAERERQMRHFQAILTLVTCPSTHVADGVREIKEFLKEQYGV